MNNEALEYAKEIKNQICLQPVIPMSWGAREWTVIKSEQYRTTLRFRVSGRIFKGVVSVSLTGMDDYTIELIRGSKVTKKFEGIYCDELVGLIDSLVETKMEVAS